MTPSEQRIRVDGHELRLSNLEKVLYPTTGLTKAGVIDYYHRVAPAILPHLSGRHLTLLRLPDGIGGEAFFEKNCPRHRPPWVHTARIRGRRSGDVVEHCVVDDLPTLVWLANLAALELHAPMARATDPDRPTTVVFDLDPGSPAGLVESTRVAIDLRSILDQIGLEAFPKTSGKKGLHVYVPLNDPTGPDHEEARAFAHAVAEIVARRSEVQVVTRMDRSLRSGRVFIDWSQNARHKTTVAPYSLRASETPSASTPVTWEEVEACDRRDDPSILNFDLDQVASRVASSGDPFAPVQTIVQKLPDLGRADV